MKENCNNPSKNSRYHSSASFEFRNVFDGRYTYRSRGKISILIVQRFAKRRKCRKVFRIRVRKRYLVSEKLRYIAWWFTSGRERDILFFLERVCKSHRNRSGRRSSGIPELSQEDNSRGAMDEETELFLPLLWGPRPNGEEREKRRWLKMLDEVYIHCEEKVEEKFWPTMRKIFVRRWNISTLLVQYWNVVDERRGTCGTFVCEISRCVSVFRWNLKIEILFPLKKNGSVFGEKRKRRTSIIEYSLLNTLKNIK